jgi:hypothetical protein
MRQRAQRSGASLDEATRVLTLIAARHSRAKGCNTPSSAISAAISSPGEILDLPSGATSFSLTGFPPYLWVLSPNGRPEPNVLTFANGSLVKVYPRSDGMGRTFVFGNGSIFTIASL